MIVHILCCCCYSSYGFFLTSIVFRLSPTSIIPKVYALPNSFSSSNYKRKTSYSTEFALFNSAFSFSSNYCDKLA